MEVHGFSPTSEFQGNFGGYIQQVQRELEAFHGEDAGDFENVVERAQAEAPFIACRNWLDEHWGDHFACPVCGNIRWVVSGVGEAVVPAGFLVFAVSCGFCANTMQVTPGQAFLDEPIRAAQLQFPAGEK